MVDHSSSESSPTEFAFAPPAIPDNINTNNSTNGNNNMTKQSFVAPSISPTGQLSGPSFNGSFMPMNFNNSYGYSSASSFSSTGSATGSSFSSADALPAISRDFVRPSSNETRRPATAGGAFQGGGAMRFQRIGKDAEVPIEEEDVFIDPFSANGQNKDTVSQGQDAVDPRSGMRRASESQTNAPQWQFNNDFNQHGQFNNILHQMQPMQNAQRGTTSRPQTSDGLPTYSGLQMPNQVSLPSARTIVGSLDNMVQPGFYHNVPSSSSHMPFRDARASMPEMTSTSSFPGDRAYAMGNGESALRPAFSHPNMSSSNAGASQSKSRADSTGGSNDIQFVSLGGPAHKKRPRRRYDEIERLYGCGFNGCDKSYGTLNHLNAHVAMQKHGEKRLPTEFKEMRKSWRKKKREVTAGNGAAPGFAGNAAWNRGSISSSSEGDFDRRESGASMMTDFSHRGSLYSSYGQDSSRPTTSSSVASSALSDGRPMTSGSAYGPASTFVHPSYMQQLHIQQQQQQQQQQQSQFPPQGQMQSGGQLLENRRASAGFHIPMPQQQTSGFRQAEGDHPTPTPNNPYPLPAQQPKYMQPQQQYQQMGNQHPSHQQQQQQQQQQPQQPQGSFFSTLTSPMPVQTGYQQFAFQR